MRQIERASKEPLPEQIARTIESMIGARTWRVGERIPSIRESASHFGVSPTTVAQAYDLLVLRGLVDARARSGYYVGRSTQPIDGLEAPRPARNLPIEAHQIRPLEIMKRMHQAGGRRDMVELGTALGAVARPGEIVALESPTYHGFLRALRARGLRALELPSDPDSGMDTSALERALEHNVPVRAVLTTPAVSNPLGATMSPERRRHLVSLALAHDLTLIEDMTYTALTFCAEDRRALACADDVLVVRLGSLSKSLAPGYRIGWCMPGGFEDRIRYAQMNTTMASPTPTQLVAAEMMRDGSLERCLESQRSVFSDKIEYIRCLIASAFPSGTRVTRPKGGHVLWVELDGVSDTTELFERCVARGVSFAPGELFSNTDAFRHSLRINAALEWNSAQLSGLDVIAEEVHRTQNRLAAPNTTSNS